MSPYDHHFRFVYNGVVGHKLLNFDRTHGQTFIVPETRKFHRKRGSYFFCLVPRVAVWHCRVTVWYSLLSYCSFTSVIMTSQRKAQRFPQRQRVAVTLQRTFMAYLSLKCISHRSTRNIIKSQCWIQTDKSQSRVIRCHKYQSRLPHRLAFVTSYHPRLRFVCLDPTLGLDYISLG